MNLTEYLRIAIKRGWIAILTALLAAAAALIFSQIQTPQVKKQEQLLSNL